MPIFVLESEYQTHENNIFAPNYEQNLVLANAIQTDAINYGEKQKNRTQ